MLQELKQVLSLSKLKTNMIFVISALAFSLLIFDFSKLWILISVLFALSGITLALCINNLLNDFKKSPLFIKVTSCVLSACVELISIKGFISRWNTSDIFSSTSSKISADNNLVLVIIASLLALLALYFLTLLFNIIFIELLKLYNENIHYKHPKSCFKNIKNNLLLIISSFGFIALNIKFAKSSIISLPIAFIFILLIFSQITNIKQKIKSIATPIKIYSAVSTLGITFFEIIYYTESVVSKVEQLPSSMVNILLSFGINPATALKIPAILLPLISILFIYVFSLLLLDFVVKKIYPLISSLTKAEIIIYSLVLIAMTAYACYAFIGSNAFWGSPAYFDVIYTSDSSTLVSSNAYLRLTHPENDLRQPLFAVFSAPFIGFGYALSIPFSFISPIFSPIFMNVIQLAMLILANIILSKTLKLTPIESIFFVLFISTTYTTLLFTVMMEQYIVAYFWMMFTIYSYVKTENTPRLPFIGASGTLLTSFVLLPISFKTAKSNKLQSIITDIEKNILYFGLLLLAFGRADIFIEFSSKSKQFVGYTEGVNFIGRVNQYFSFVYSCFAAPDAGMNYTKYEHISWQLTDTNTALNAAGVIIFILCIISIFINRKNIAAKISGWWLAFSALMLCIIGWGAFENGMILYSLYFGWAFWALIFQLIKWLSKKLNFKYLVPIICSVLMVVLVILNYQGLSEMITFAFTYYPN